MFDNYRCAHRNDRKNIKVEQKSFHVHFSDGAYSGEGDWEVRLISEIVQKILERENHFGNMNLTLFFGLNEREVALF